MSYAIQPEIWDKLLTAIANGLTDTDACDIVNIARSTLYDKKKEDIDFALQCKKAHAGFKLLHINNIAKASKTQWQASAWLLERKFPNEFGQRVQADITSGGKELAPLSWFGKKMELDIEDAEIIEDDNNNDKEAT